jgi:hypothetical protein
VRGWLGGSGGEKEEAGEVRVEKKMDGLMKKNFNLFFAHLRQLLSSDDGAF